MSEFRGFVPGCAVHHDKGMGTGRHGLREFVEKHLHRPGTDLGDHKGGPGIAGGTDGTEDLRGDEPLVMQAKRPNAALVPAVGHAPPLPDPGFVPEPEFDRGCVRVVAPNLFNRLFQALFLNSSRALGSASGCLGRAFRHDRSRPCRRFRMPLSE